MGLTLQYCCQSECKTVFSMSVKRFTVLHRSYLHFILTNRKALADYTEYYPSYYHTYPFCRQIKIHISTSLSKTCKSSRNISGSAQKYPSNLIPLAEANHTQFTRSVATDLNTTQVSLEYLRIRCTPDQSTLHVFRNHEDSFSILQSLAKSSAPQLNPLHIPTQLFIKVHQIIHITSVRVHCICGFTHQLTYQSI